MQYLNPKQQIKCQHAIAHTISITHIVGQEELTRAMAEKGNEKLRFQI